jgi:quinoprotein glucose dehydrogenase
MAKIEVSALGVQRPLRALLACALLAACSQPPAIDPSGPVSEWRYYGSEIGGGRFSPLTQITPANVAALEPAWTYHTGDVKQPGESLAPTSFQATPILAFGTLYFCTPYNRVIALDPDTGEERWVYDPKVDVSQIYVTACRGVSIWEDAQAAPGSACRQRIVTGTLDARLIALDAETGRPCPGFGQGGSVDLALGIGDRRPGEYGVTSPPLVLGDRIVTGTLVLDNRRVDAPGGVVRAFDARSGAQLWAWDPVLPGTPAPSDALQAEGVRYRRGTTNAWSILSADPERGLVYVPTGNTSPDYYGGHRGDLDSYSSSVVALRAETGEVTWHFQTVHHDVFDYDVASQPTLFRFPGAQGSVPALVQATKLGHLFFLNRETGEPLFPVEERPAPQGGAPGETLAATQPFPTRPLPIHPAGPVTPDDAFGYTFYDRGKCRELIASLRSDGIFTPPSLQGSIHYPGMMGGANWGSPSIDPGRGILIVNTSRVASMVRLIPRAEFTGEMQSSKFGYEPALGAPYADLRMPLLSPFGAPCTKPPWGTLVAIDVATGDKRWERPLGTVRDMAPFPIWLFADEGVPNQGGSVLTASGLAFIGAATDAYLRAFSTETGEELWKHRLPAPGMATPMTYRSGANARQMVVIAAGGHGILQTKVSDAVVAFALPEN